MNHTYELILKIFTFAIQKMNDNLIKERFNGTR
jgi:hypothetical protein